MRDAVINGLLAGGLAIAGAVVGWVLSWRQQRGAEKRAERAGQLALMQQLVVEVGNLERARKVFNEAHLSAKSRIRTGLMAAMEFYSVWSARGSNWEASAVTAVPRSVI